MKTKTSLLLALAAICNLHLMGQEHRTIKMENNEDLDVFYENDNPDDFKKITLEVFPLDVGDIIDGAGASYTIRATVKVADDLTGSLEWRGLYKQVENSPADVTNGENKLFWEALALSDYTVFSFNSQSKYKVRLVKEGRFYSYVNLPHTAKNEFRLQLGASYLNRTGGTDYIFGEDTRYTATRFGFMSVLAGLNYKRSVNARISGAKLGQENFTIGNVFLSKRTWSIYGRVGYSVYSNGEYFVSSGVDGSFRSITEDEFKPEMSYVFLRIGASIQQYLSEDVSISFLLEGGTYPGMKVETDIKQFFPCARVGLAFDI